jgi:hypothetical protein
MVGCVGKKTALLQILVVCRLVRFANVLVCAMAVHFIVFLFLSLYSKLSTVSFFTLGGNDWNYMQLGIAGCFPVEPQNR